MLNTGLKAGRFQGTHIMAAESPVCKIMNTYFLKHKTESWQSLSLCLHILGVTHVHSAWQILNLLNPIKSRTFRNNKQKGFVHKYGDLRDQMHALLVLYQIMTGKESLSSASAVLSCKGNFLSVNYLTFKTQLIALLPFRSNSKISPHFKVMIKA